MKRNFLFLIFLASLSLPFAAFPPSAIATADTLYLSDIIKDARPDPAYAADGGKTRSDVLKNVIGAETWVEHFIADDTSIELLIYNRLVYGVIVREKGGKTTYYLLNKDLKTYSVSGPSAPSGWAVTMPSYDAYLEKATDDVAAKRFKDAIETLDEAVEEHGYKTAEIYFFLGYSYDKLGEVEYAEKYYRDALSLDPDIPDALYNLGMLLRDQGRHKEAALYFDKYLSIKPDTPHAESIRDYVNTYR